MYDGLVMRRYKKSTIGYGQQHGSAHAAFTGKGLHLTQDAKSFPHYVANLVQDLGKVTTCLPLNGNRGG